MAQDNEYVQKLVAARDREVAHRRDVAETLAKKHNRGDAENMRDISPVQSNPLFECLPSELDFR